MSAPLKFTFPTVISLYFNSESGEIQIFVIEFTEADFLGVIDRWHLKNQSYGKSV
jgi:hypothetical protein